MRRIMWSLALAGAALLAPAWSLADEESSAMDKELSRQIARKLKLSGQLKDYSIGVKYKDGTAWLSGHVTSQQQLQAALQVVGGMQGVDQVVNNLSIKSAPAASANRRASAQSLPQPRATEQLSLSRAGSGVSRRSPAAERPAVQPLPRPARRVSYPQMSPYPAMAGMRRGAPAGYAELDSAGMEYGGEHGGYAGGSPIPAVVPGTSGGVAPASYDAPHMPNYAWPSYAAYPNYAALTYPKQYSPTAWPYIGPFYPYPQVPLGWRKVTLEWDDGWWMLDFDDRGDH